MKIKDALVPVLVVCTTCLASCSNRFTSPKVNPNPKSKVVFTVIANATRGGGALALKDARVHYTTTGPNCGYMNYFAAIGGTYWRPKAEIDFPAHASNVTIYRDYFMYRKKCPFKIDQVVIRMSDVSGSYAYINVNTLMDKNNLHGARYSTCKYDMSSRYYICSNKKFTDKFEQTIPYDFDVTVRRNRVLR